jgi:hypothetical protein
MTIAPASWARANSTTIRATRPASAHELDLDGQARQLELPAVAIGGLDGPAVLFQLLVDASRMVPNIIGHPPTWSTLTVDREAGAAQRKGSQDWWAVRPQPPDTPRTLPRDGLGVVRYGPGASQRSMKLVAAAAYSPPRTVPVALTMTEAAGRALWMVGLSPPPVA